MEKGTDKTRKPHHGRNVTRLREIRRMKQETLASLLGLTQQAVSKMEQSETIDDERIEEISKILNFSPELIKTYNDDSLIFYIEHMHDQSSAYNQNYNYQCTFNPLDEIKRLNDEKDELYKALLKEKDEKIALLQQLLDMKK